MTKDPSAYQVTDMVMALMNMYASELRLAGYENLLAPNLPNKDLYLASQESVAVGNKAVSVRPYVMWSQYREVYAIHSHMSNALLRIKSDTKIPASVLRNLRHPNPFIALDGGIPIVHADRRPGIIRGMFVTGAISMAYPQVNGSNVRIEGLSGQDARASAIVDTTSEVANVLRVTVISDVRSMDGEHSEFTDLTHLTVPLTEEFTIEELVEAVISSGFAWNTLSEGMAKQDVRQYRRRFLEDMARVVVSHLLYVTSRTAEISKPKDHRPPFQKMHSWDRAPKPSKVHKVGWQVGSAIADYVRSEGRNEKSGAASDRTIKPHIRAPHVHLYRVGPGRSEVEFKFLDAIKVNFDKYDGKTRTMHQVR